MMKIRKSNKKDFKKIAEILRIEFKKYPYHEKWTEKSALKLIKDYYKQKYFMFVTEVDKEIVGFIIGRTFFWFDGTRGYIHEIAVSSKFQGKGIGKELLASTEKYLKKKGAKWIGFMSAKKSKAFKIYKKLGFKEWPFVYMDKRLK